MATRTREGVPGKEKRGTSPSTAATTAAQRRRSPKPSKTTSPVRSPDSAESEKHVPNYLKPTVCSGLDTSSKQQGKKPVFSADKPVLGRRRSFDKPPSASAAMRISPNPVRTSSFSGKGISDKNPRGSKDAVGKQHNGLYARPVTAAVRKSTGAGTANVKKKETGSGSSITATTANTEQVSSPTEKMDVSSVTDVSETETLSENQESPVAAECEKQQGIVQIGECDEEVKDQENVAMDSVMEDENVVKVNDLKAGNLEEESIKFEQAEEEDDNTDDTNKMVTTETCLEIHETKIVSIDTCSTTEDHQETDEQEDHNSQVEEPKEPTTNEAIQHEDIEDKQGEEEVTDINETEESKEMEVEKEVVEENPLPEAAETGASKAQVVQGKKESAVVSNDVIEETAKQLREQRKNKVKALAGAFETVISLQEHK